MTRILAIVSLFLLCTLGLTQQGISGSIIYNRTIPVTKLAAAGATEGQVIKIVGGQPTWGAGSGSVTSVAATQPAQGFTITGGAITTSGTFTFNLTNDLAGLEGLGGTGYPKRTGTDTWSIGSIAATDISATGSSPGQVLTNVGGTITWAAGSGGGGSGVAGSISTLTATYSGSAISISPNTPATVLVFRENVLVSPSDYTYSSGASTVTPTGGAGWGNGDKITVVWTNSQGTLQPPIGFSFTANGSGYFVADQSYSLTVANVSGTGTLAYEVDTGSGFASDPLPITLAPGNTLKITVSGLSGYKAVTLE